MFEADAATISAHLIGVEIVIFAQGGLMVWGFGVMRKQVANANTD